jgi:hypothetical protein
MTASYQLEIAKYVNIVKRGKKMSSYGQNYCPN